MFLYRAGRGSIEWPFLLTCPVSDLQAALDGLVENGQFESRTSTDGSGELEYRRVQSRSD